MCRVVRVRRKWCCRVINDAVYIVNENVLSKDTGTYDTQDISVINVDVLDKSIDTPEFAKSDMVSGCRDVSLKYQSLQVEFLALILISLRILYRIVVIIRSMPTKTMRWKLLFCGRNWNF